MTFIGLFWSPLSKDGFLSSFTAGFLVTVADGLVTVVDGLVTVVDGRLTSVEGLAFDEDGFFAVVGVLSVTDGLLAADGFLVTDGFLSAEELPLTEGLEDEPEERGATPEGFEAVPEGRVTRFSEEVPVLPLVVCASTSD